MSTALLKEMVNAALGPFGTVFDEVQQDYGVPGPRFILNRTF